MCEVVVNRVEGAQFNPTLGEYESVNVVGQVSGCPATLSTPSGDFTQIEVRLSLESGEVRTEVASVLTNDNLSATFEWTAFFKGVACKGRAEVHARCLGGPADCSTEVQLEMLCEVSHCPAVTFSEPADDGCDESGNRLVSLTATVQGPPLNQFAVWSYGAGNLAQSEFSNSTQTTVQLAYEPADLDQTEVIFGLTPDCEYPLEIAESLRRPCDAACRLVTFSAPQDGGCDESGNRIIEVSAQLSGAPFTGYVLWRYGADRVANSYVDGENTATAILLYASADLDEQGLTLELSPDCRYDATIPRELLQTCEPETEPEPDPGTEQEEETGGNGSQGFNLCLLWLIANIILLILTGIAIVIAGCAPNPYSVGVAIALVVVTTISWILFWFICLHLTGDCDLARWTSFLLDMLATAMAIIAIIWGIVTAIFEVSLGCFIGALITFAYYSLIALWFKNVVLIMGCYRDSSYLPWED